MNARLHEIEKLFEQATGIAEGNERCSSLLKIYNDLVHLLSEASSLHFNTLFARVSYITSRYPKGKNWAHALQVARREIHQRELPDETLIPVLESCIRYLLIVSEEIKNEKEIEDTLNNLALPILPHKKRAGKYKKRFARVIASEWRKEEKQLLILDEEEPELSFILQYHVPGVNDLFSDALELALSELGTPLILGLTDVDCTNENHYIPSYITILPDLLLDVTSIVQVSDDTNASVVLSILDLFLPSTTSPALLTGVVANYFLDELIRDPLKTFQELFAGSFKFYPLEYARMTDEQVISFSAGLKVHYENIRNVIVERFPVLGIDRQKCIIEPSYFSPAYGIKGRLDLFFEHGERQSASIVELKSNKPFRPNTYGLSSSNYHQTLLYDLMIQSSNGTKYKRSNFILYSSESQDTLRYAVSLDSIQKEIIHHRNELALLQMRLTRLDHDSHGKWLDMVKPDQFPALKGYVKTNLSAWHTVYDGLSPGEQHYFKAFTAFIAREHLLARIGTDQGNGSMGLAGLWLEKTASKEDRYEILQCLELKEIIAQDHYTAIRFARTARTNPLANFRAGDIAVLYPFDPDASHDPTHFQLHRANVVSITAQTIEVRLRNSQVNTNQIEITQYWNIEHDLLDSSFKSLYQSLWQLMCVEPMKRHLILGLTTEQFLSNGLSGHLPVGLTKAQEVIYKEAINAGFLYMLWGPPGTGKTSVMLRSWVWYYHTFTSARIALLAYTNKAVDEICAVLERLDPAISENYVRVGSRAGTGEPYRHKLLDHAIGQMTKRVEIKEKLNQTRIVVGTVSSMQGKNEIFHLMQFDLAIIDEASQLLEPAVVGLMTKFKKVILIGDHMQLPAVSIQPARMGQSVEGQSWSRSIGLTALSMSYFERLYRLHEAKKWDHAIGKLYEQGRMHSDIMAFANRWVYKEVLTCVDPFLQGRSLASIFPNEDSPLLNHRLLYIPSKSKWAESYAKTNAFEAKLVIQLIRYWREKIRASQLDWNIGVITPFRAQIAAITHLAHQMDVNLDGVLIDTVERFQGGARDIIIMSCAVNSAAYFSRITAHNQDGVDRKLNVAVTRARQQFILIGVESILRQDSFYNALIEMTHVEKIEIIPESDHHPAA